MHNSTFYVGEITEYELPLKKKVNISRADVFRGESYYILFWNSLYNNYLIFNIAKAKYVDKIHTYKDEEIKTEQITNYLYRPVLLIVNTNNMRFIIQKQNHVVDPMKCKRYLPILLSEYYNDAISISLETIKVNYNSIVGKFSEIVKIRLKYRKANPHPNVGMEIADKFAKDAKANKITVEAESGGNSCDKYNPDNIKHIQHDENDGNMDDPKGVDIVSKESPLSSMFAASINEKYGRGGYVEGLDHNGSFVKIGINRNKINALEVQVPFYVTYDDYDTIRNVVRSLSYILEDHV